MLDEENRDRLEMMEIIQEEWAKEVRELSKEVERLRAEVNKKADANIIEELKKEIEVLKEKARKNEASSGPVTQETKEKEAEEEERAAKEMRKRNVVIKGVGGSRKWREEIKRLVNAAAGKTIQIVRERECGGVDLTRERGTAIVELWSEEERADVLKGRAKVETKEDVIIEEDMTYKEREKRWRIKAKIAEERYRRNCATKEAAEKDRRVKDGEAAAAQEKENKRETERKVATEKEKYKDAAEETEKTKTSGASAKKKELIDKLADVLNELRREEGRGDGEKKDQE